LIIRESEYIEIAIRHRVLVFGNAGCEAGYEEYLADTHRRITAARRAGRRVMVGPFLADQYESYADALGLAPGTAKALRAYDEMVGRIGPDSRPWLGEAIDSVTASLRRATELIGDREVPPPASRARRWFGACPRFCR
jgi:hypothetical protein